jgi:cyclohexa-1,5-dienecarbonyl-CoA hydratase
MEPAVSHSLIQFRVSGRVAYVTLSAPPLNTLTVTMMREINAALDSLSRMPPGAVYAVVFSAAPEATAFSTGISIEDHRAATAYQTLQEFHNIYRNLHFLGKPVIGVVNGQAFSAGCELVAYCDIVVASATATFGQPEARLGLFPPMATALLPRIVGARRALRMVLLGEALDAHEAQRAGLVDYVVPSDQLAAKAKELVDALGGYSAPVLETARRALHTSMFQDVEARLEEIEDQYLNQLMSLQDAAEGLEAFRQKRKPVWRHR